MSAHHNDLSPLRAGYLPGLDEAEVSWETLEFNNSAQTYKVQVPSLTAAQYEGLAKRVQTIGREQLQSTPLADILKAIDHVVVSLLDTKSPSMKLALEVLPKVTGFDPEMMRLTLHSYLQTFKWIGLKQFLAQDFNNPQVLEEFVPNVRGGMTRAVAPSLTLHSWSGNVPALGLWSLISALLVKAPSIGKVASAEPLFVSWFVRLLVQELPQIKDALAIVWWRGGEHTQCRPLLNAAELVLAYGSDQSLHSLKSDLPTSTRFLGYGHKLSFALLSKSSMNRALSTDCVSKAAWDVIAHDKGGCYSPHVFYVQKGGAVSPQEFAQRLLSELKTQSARFPSGVSDLSEKAEQESWLQSQRFKAIQSKDVEVMGSKSSAEMNEQPWVVFCDAAIDLAPSPSKRFVQVVAFENWSEVISSLSKARPYLQTVGVSLSTSELAEVAPMLAHSGVTRIAAIGSMTAPEAGWHHDGRFGLADLVNMVDLELSAISIGQNFNDYRI
jgi:hypothetical protein